MIKILISACLLGEKVRYDGRGRYCAHEILAAWAGQGRLVPICPELAGGLSVPRAAAEISGGDGRHVLSGAAGVHDKDGRELSKAFLAGARQALELAQRENIQLAVLTEGSPSCGSNQIYGGDFDGRLVSGMGVTAAMLQAAGIAIFNERQLTEAAAYLERLQH